MITKKQKDALDRGRDIRDTRGALAVLIRIASKYPHPFAGSGAIQDALIFLKLFHNRQFGKKTCKKCKTEHSNPLDYYCNKCNEVI